MGVLKKLKDIFYDEEIIEEDDEEEVKESKPIIREVKKEPIKKQTIEQREIPKEKETKELNTEAIEFRRPEENKRIEPEYKKEQREVSERELYQSKQTFKFPILDDDEFETPRVRKTRSGSTNIMDVERRNREIKRKEEVKEPTKPKVFKPSPVISPVYGIMDKDYDKTEIMNRSKEIANANRTSTDYDSIRKKAYGSNYEKETKKTDVTKTDVTKVLENVNEIEQELEKVRKNTNSRSNIESLLQSIEDNANLTVGDMEELKEKEEKSEVSRLDKYKREDEKNRRLEEIGDKTLEHDLFNLIDSMYDEEDKE